MKGSFSCRLEHPWTIYTRSADNTVTSNKMNDHLLLEGSATQEAHEWDAYRISLASRAMLISPRGLSFELSPPLSKYWTMPDVQYTKNRGRHLSFLFWPFFKNHPWNSISTYTATHVTMQGHHRWHRDDSGDVPFRFLKPPPH